MCLEMGYTWYTRTHDVAISYEIDDKPWALENPISRQTHMECLKGVESGISYCSHL